MILNHFRLSDFKSCKTLDEVFKVLNIGEGTDYPFTDNSVWGKRANYANYFMTDSTFELINDALSENDENQFLSRNRTKHSHEAIAWTNYGPISSGPRYKKLEKKIGKLNDTVLYIVTPEDDMYQEPSEV